MRLFEIILKFYWKYCFKHQLHLVFVFIKINNSKAKRVPLFKTNSNYLVSYRCPQMVNNEHSNKPHFHKSMTNYAQNILALWPIARMVCIFHFSLYNRRRFWDYRRQHFCHIYAFLIYHLRRLAVDTDSVHVVARPILDNYLSMPRKCIGTKGIVFSGRWEPTEIRACKYNERENYNILKAIVVIVSQIYP